MTLQKYHVCADNSRLADLVDAALRTPAQVRTAEIGRQGREWAKRQKLPEGATISESGAIILRQIELPEASPRPELGRPTAAILRDFDAALRTAEFAAHLQRIPSVRSLETYRAALIHLVRIAGEKGAWQFAADRRWLGEKLGKSGTAADKTMTKLDAAGLLRYRHPTTAAQAMTGPDGRPPKWVDLRPLAELLSTDPFLRLPNPNQEVWQPNARPHETDLYSEYSGAGRWADATMHTPYRYAMTRRVWPTVMVRPLTLSALAVLDVLQDVGTATRAEIAHAKGMTAGTVAGATRVLESVGLVSVEWEGPGRAKIYTLIKGWESHLRRKIPEMTSWGARDRLILRNYGDRIAYLHSEIKRAAGDAKRTAELVRRRQSLERAKKICAAKAARRGTYGLPAPEYGEPRQWTA